VLEYQKSHYYRAKTERNTPRHDQEAQGETGENTKQNEPPQPQKNAKKSPLDFD
jgi:hypothetical protein